MPLAVPTGHLIPSRPNTQITAAPTAAPIDALLSSSPRDGATE